MSPPSWTSLPLLTPPHPCRSSQSTRLELAVSYSEFPLAVYSTRGNVHASVLLAPLLPPSPSHTMSTSLSSMSVPPLLDFFKQVYISYIS